MTSNYYWRAVRRIAKRLNISISAARKKDWEKEANAERKRRSQAQTVIHKDVRRTKPTTKPGKPSVRAPGARLSKRRRHPAKRDVFPKLPRKPSTGGGSRQLVTGGGYGFDDEYDEEEGDRDIGGGEWEDIWEEWEDLFPTLDDMDNLEEFLEDVEYEDSDKYKEPS